MNLLWKKRLKNTGWLLLTSTGVMLLVAGVARKDHKKCTDVKVEVSGVNKHIFIDEKEMLKILNANGDLTGMPLEQINLQLLENRLEKDTWIRNAELFFDNNQVLNVRVEEREPVARIFTAAGVSYYIDSSCARLPLSDKLSARVPMFTNFPSEARRLRARDSILLVRVKELATFIQSDSFWNAQAAQVNITNDRTFEMIPTIGNHIVLLGKGEDLEQKFDRLYSFYKQVWTKVGLEKYSVIDVQYKGQVVATRRGEGYTSIDSTKAREVFFKVLNENKPDTIDEVAIKVKPVASKELKAKTEIEKQERITSALTAKVKSEMAKERESPDPKGRRENPNLKERGEAEKAETKINNEAQKPKAVMTKKT